MYVLFHAGSGGEGNLDTKLSEADGCANRVRESLQEVGCRGGPSFYIPKFLDALHCGGPLIPAHGLAVQVMLKPEMLELRPRASITAPAAGRIPFDGFKTSSIRHRNSLSEDSGQTN